MFELSACSWLSSMLGLVMIRLIPEMEILVVQAALFANLLFGRSRLLGLLGE